MSGVTDEIISRLPSKCPIPDYSGRGSLLHPPPQTNKSMLAPTSPSNNILLDQICKLRKQNKQIREEMNELRLTAKNLESSKNSRSVILEGERSKRHVMRERGEQVIEEKDKIILELKRDLERLERVLSEDSQRCQRLQKQNKTLREVIEMDIRLNQENSKKMSERQESKIRELVEENRMLKRCLTALETQGKKQPNNTHLNLSDLQATFEEVLKQMARGYQQFMRRCDSCEENIDRIEEAAQRARANARLRVRVHKSHERNSVEDSLENIEKQMTNTHHTPSQLTKSIILKSVEVQTHLHEEQARVSEQLRQQLSVSRQLITQYQQEALGNQETVRTLQNRVSALNTKVGVLEQELRNRRQSPYITDQKQMLELRREIQELKRIIELSRKPFTPTLDRLKECQQIIRDLREQLQHSKEIIKELEVELERVDDQSIGLDMIQEVKEIKDQFNRLTQEKNEILITLRVSEEASQRLKGLNSELEDGNRVLSGEVGSIKMELGKMERERRSMELKEEENQRVIGELRGGFNSLQEGQRELEERNAQLQVALESIERDMEAIENRNREIEMYNQQLRGEAGATDNLLIELFHEINRVKEILARISFEPLQTMIHQYSNSTQSQLQKRLSKIYTLQNQLRSIKTRKQNNTELTTHLQQVEEQKRTLSNDLRTQRLSNAQLSNELTLLTSKMGEYINTAIKSRGDSNNVVVSEFYYKHPQENSLQDIEHKISCLKGGVERAEQHVVTAIKRS